MINPFEAIDFLIEMGVRRVELNNDQPYRDPINLADTLEAACAELISHYQRRVQELLEANNAYLDRARVAEMKVAMLRDDFWSKPRTPPTIPPYLPDEDQDYVFDRLLGG